MTKTHQTRYKKILVPLDGSGWSQRAIPHAIEIARANDAELILLHVFTPPAREYAPDIALRSAEDPHQSMREQAKQYLVGLRTELRNENCRVRTHLSEGADAAHLICDYADGEDIDLIVMSTRGRSGIARLLFGSVAQKVMECIHVPVLLIKPDEE